jgi:gluconokinase
LILIIMGVVGAGKTTIGDLLAHKLGWQFADADDYHPAANKNKIRHGIALDDDDRIPWLAALHASILKWSAEKRNVVLACSALKHRYREELRADSVQFVYLDGTPELIRQRLAGRHRHFATDSILKSQFEDLEKPVHAIAVQIDRTPEEIANEIIDKLKLTGMAYSDATQK